MKRPRGRPAQHGTRSRGASCAPAGLRRCRDAGVGAPHAVVVLQDEAGERQAAWSTMQPAVVNNTAGSGQQYSRRSMVA